MYRSHGVPLPLPPSRVKYTEPSQSTPEHATPTNKHTSISSVDLHRSINNNLMTYVLKLLEELWDNLKKRCDAEIKVRIRQKNQHIVSISESYVKYKHILIATLASGNGRVKAQNSSLNGAFVGAFMFTKVETAPSDTASLSGNNQSVAVVASGGVGAVGAAIGGWFTSLTAAPDAASSNNTNTPSNISLKPMFTLASPPIVLFYCACLITTTPGTIYVTVDNIYIQYGLPLLPQTKVVYPIQAIDHITDDENANIATLLITLFKKKKVISVTPMAIDCSLLKTMIYSLIDYKKSLIDSK